MGLLRAIDMPAPSNKPSRSEREAVSLPARGRFSASERPFLWWREAVLLFFPGLGFFFLWAGNFFSLGRAQIFAGQRGSDDDDSDDSGGIYFLTVWQICSSIILYNIYYIYNGNLFLQAMTKIGRCHRCHRCHRQRKTLFLKNVDIRKGAMS